MDRHYRRLIGFAVLTSLFAAASEISQNRNRSLLTYPSPSQIDGSSAGQQAADLGTQITRRNLNVQPTIKIPIGYRFNVRVNRDILFDSQYEPTTRPTAPKCLATGSPISKSTTLKPMLYTVVMDYKGGTYVSQVETEEVEGALRAWAAALEVTEIAEFDDRRKAELIGEIETKLSNDMGPVLLRGLANVWCTSASVSGGWMLINIIATAA